MKKTPNLSEQYNRLFKESNRNLLTEESETADDLYYNLGVQNGANQRKTIDHNSREAKFIVKIANALYNKGVPLKDLKDKRLIAYTKGVIDSAGSRMVRWSGEWNQDILQVIDRLRLVHADGLSTKIRNR